MPQVVWYSNGLTTEERSLLPFSPSSPGFPNQRLVPVLFPESAPPCIQPSEMKSNNKIKIVLPCPPPTPQSSATPPPPRRPNELDCTHFHWSPQATRTIILIEQQSISIVGWNPLITNINGIPTTYLIPPPTIKKWKASYVYNTVNRPV